MAVVTMTAMRVSDLPKIDAARRAIGARIVIQKEFDNLQIGAPPRMGSVYASLTIHSY